MRSITSTSIATALAFFLTSTNYSKCTYVRTSQDENKDHRQMKGEQILTAEMSDYPDIPSFKKDPEVQVKGKVHAIFQPHGSLTVQYNLHGLKKSPVCRCCGIAIYDGESCHTVAEIQPWPYYNNTDPDIHGNPWNQAMACYALTDYSGETGGMFGIYTGYNYDDYNGKIVVVHDETGFKIGCGVLYPKEWLE